MLKSLLSRLAITLFVLAILYMGGRLAYASYNRYLLRLQIANLKAEVSELESRNREITTFLDQLSDRGYLLLKTKEKFNLKEEGEEVAVIPSTKQNQEQADKEEEETRYWKKWQEFFFGKK